MKRHFQFRYRLAQLFCLPLAFVGCATQPREPGRAVTQPTSIGERRDVSANTSSVSNAARDEAAPVAATPPRAVEPVRAQPAANAEKKQTVTGANADTERARGGIAAPASKSAAPSVPPRASMHEEAAPAFAEAPELRAALLEFNTEWEKLTTSKACDDACHAFDSMRRSAKRICDLVASGDPQDRCRSARAKVEQAGQDLSSRCADCR